MSELLCQFKVLLREGQTEESPVITWQLALGQLRLQLWLNVGTSIDPTGLNAKCQMRFTLSR